MPSAGLKREVERILDALPESATLRDLLCALETSIEPVEAHVPHSEAESDEAQSALGIRDTCAARRRRAADRD